MFTMFRPQRRRARHLSKRGSVRHGSLARRACSMLGLMGLTLALGEVLPARSLSFTVPEPQALQLPGNSGGQVMPNQSPVMQSNPYQQGGMNGQVQNKTVGPFPQVQTPDAPGAPPLTPGAQPLMPASMQGVHIPGVPASQQLKEYPLDPALRIANEAKARYQQVQTYRCILISQERIKNKLLPENVMELSYRKNPLSVYMKWLGPTNKGQEVCYVQGRYQNSMRVLPAKGGFAGLIGWTTIAVNSPQVFENSRHIITETGFGNIIEQCAKAWTQERTLGKTQVSFGEYEYNKRRCIKVETIHTTNEPIFYSYRFVVFFDRETGMPVRMESYDWPRSGSPPGGDLLECFSFVNIELNANIPEAVFTH
jgi:hypothetical protein